MSDLIRVPAGLYGVVVSQTQIAKGTADGHLVYRGYDIGDLVRHANFEETAYLVSEGSLPNRKEYEAFSRRLHASMGVPADVLGALKLHPASANSIDVLRTGISILGAKDRKADVKSARFSLAAKVPTLVANGYRLRNGLKPIAPRRGLGYAANFLFMLNGHPGADDDVSALEKALVLYMEHDFNASAFTVRVVTSTKADVYSAVIAGLCALKGPLHGGANQDVTALLKVVGRPELAEKVISKRLVAGEKVPGFGHRIYKTVDPRAQIAKNILKDLVAEHRDAALLYETCVAVEAFMWKEKKIPANLDFYAAPIFYAIGIPTTLNTSIFAMSRVFGWIAHYEEQSREGKLIRPDAEYVGKKGLAYTPLSAR